jgi:putative peptide zinc metalloprotease protein
LTYVESRMNVWEALAGRAPGDPGGPADPGLWGAVVDRLNPTSARPVLRAGIEAVQLTSARGTSYVMLRSPDDGARAGYLRLTPEEWQLALLMDGDNTVARLVAEFARIAGRLAPDQVRRVVADLAGNRMLDELPTEAFRPLDDTRGAPVPAAGRGRRALIVNVDGFVTALYRAGGRFLFGKPALVLTALLAVAGLAVFAATWVRGSRSLFLTRDSYLLGAVVLVLLNLGVLVLHELSRALAAKAAGREVPAGGVLIYFGIPSLFVDTTDVWMAGRRARMLVAAAGPVGALLAAGVVQLAGLAVPALGGLVFKLAFLLYLNAFFQLSPFLPLDGSYLLMDWLEVPHLRARGLAWIGGRLRGRPPRWSKLDREGRLVGAYGILAVVWLALAAVLTLRVFTDRISGLATGLWHAGLLGGLLLVLVVAGLGAPAVFFLLGRLARWWRVARQRSAEKDRETDLPRRLAALRASDLGGLPEPALTSLAARARWVHPRTGRTLVLAGGSQAAVLVVVEGALQARKPGDPSGTIRHHVGPGGVVGLVNALTGRSTQLDWHTAGTTLLSIPSATVATVVGPLPGPAPQERAEAEALFADTPALTGLALDQRLALIASAQPVDLDAGAPVILPGPTHAIVVEAGVIAMPDGVELRRGTLVGPVGDGSPGMVAQTRTPVRLWVLPDASALPPLVGATARPGSPMPATRLGGVRPGAPATDAYPPLAVPPGMPDGPEDTAVDRRFESRLWWFAMVLLVVALVLTALSFRPGPAWAEMPGDHVLLTVDKGRADAIVDGRVLRLEPGDRRYLAAGSKIDVPARSMARLTFQGGSASVLCAGSQLDLGAITTDSARTRTASSTVTLRTGRLLADTTSASGAYRPLDLTIVRNTGQVVNVGAAWYAVDTSAVTVSTGRVSVGGSASAGTGGDLSCGDGVAVTPPSQTPEPSAEPSPTDLPSAPPSLVPSAPPATIPTTPTPGTVDPGAVVDPAATVNPPPGGGVPTRPGGGNQTVAPATTPPKTTPPKSPSPTAATTPPDNTPTTRPTEATPSATSPADESTSASAPTTTSAQESLPEPGGPSALV